MGLVNDYYKDSPALVRFVLEKEINELFVKLSTVSKGEKISVAADKPINIPTIAQQKQKIFDGLIDIVKVDEETPDDDLLR